MARNAAKFKVAAPAAKSPVARAAGESVARGTDARAAEARVGRVR
jgi:hypothetical protein